MKTIITIDATVGAGKTSLAKILEKELDLPLYEELGNIDTEHMLNQYYANITRWAFTLQIHFLNERFKMIKEIHNNNKGGLLDRSIFGDSIFAEMLAEDLEAGGKGMTWQEFRTYNTLLNSMLEHAQPPRLLIYLECNVETAKDRIDLRNRGLESQVPLDYWNRLNKKYREWYQNYDHSPKIKINVDGLDFVNNPEDQKYVVGLVKAKLKEFESTI